MDKINQKHFTHLHLHTEFSLLDGAISLDNLVEYGKKHNLKALAISDHGNIFGAVKFFQKCKAAGIKPILGIEAYFTPNINIKNANQKYYHLIILVQNETGYKNLCKMISFSYQKGFYFKPRIDFEQLEKYNEGLIVTSACLGGYIPSLLMNNENDKALEAIEWFKRVFGDRFYFEIQPEDQEEQARLNKKLAQLSTECNVQLVATGDCHYPHADDHEAHEVMLAIQTQSKMEDPERFTFGDCRAYMRTPQEMAEIFANYPNAYFNSGLIADRCNFDFTYNKLFFPKFAIPENQTPEEYFKLLCYKGLAELAEKRIEQQLLANYQARLDLEIDLIIKMGFVGYFLIVSEFIQWAKSVDIPVGPGRGSAAGSLVAWTLKITNIDPLKYNLLFERFLNPERISMPDIDIDFCIEGREKVIQHIKDLYGADKVCQIITFGTMMAKGVIKDISRTLGLPFEDANQLTNMIPDQLKITLDEAIKTEPKLAELIKNNTTIEKIFNLGFKLEGLTRHASKHAAGIVITPEPVDEMLPVYVPPKTSDLVTQYAMTELEAIGFLKIDLLGLKNLTLINKVTKLIKQNYNTVIDIDNLPLEDEATFKLVQKGQTSGVFQLESDGLKDVLIKLSPTKFEDIIAVNALYRPGPLGSGMVEDYIERRHGRQKIVNIFPELEPILAETYGVIVYQEQVMKIASTIAGYTLGQADILRRAMGKKKAEVMIEQKDLFVQGAVKNSFDAEKAGQLFDLMAYFAGYGFNKSHSAAYALIAYQTAYLKAHYPAEFMACLISLETSNPDKMTFYLDEARSMGINIVSPDINRSLPDFCVDHKEIIFGLQGIKNVGLTALENIVATRLEKPFKDLLDFCVRIDLRTANKRVIENLIYAGAFDKLPGNRAQKIAELSVIMEKAALIKDALLTGQMSLFGPVIKEETVHDFKPQEMWSNKETLEKEREVIGFYLSSHPIDIYKSVNIFFAAQELAINKLRPGQSIQGVALKKSSRTIVTKKGDKMAFMAVEDKVGTAELIIFPLAYKKCNFSLDDCSMIAFTGVAEIENNVIKIKVQNLIKIDDKFEFNKFEIFYDPKIMESLPQITAEISAGNTELCIEYKENNKSLMLKKKDTIAVTLELLNKCLELDIKGRLYLQ
jgi:DNA polymerase-3 subunit alpha